VRDENSHSDEDEHDASDQLRPLAQPGPQPVSPGDGQHAHAPGDEPDNDGGVPDIHVQHRHAQPHGQGVDAGGDRQHDQREAVAGIILLRLDFGVQGDPDHATAHDGQQEKGDPVVEGRDDGLDRHAQRPPYDWHEELKQPEMERKPEDGPPVLGETCRAGCKGNGERVERKREGDGEDFQELNGHSRTSWRCWCGSIIYPPRLRRQLVGAFSPAREPFRCERCPPLYIPSAITPQPALLASRSLGAFPRA
jgi:hypothetical protein